MIEVKNLSKKFGLTWALQNNNWSVGSQRAMGLLGPNGAGKSTTLKIIVGLMRASEGEVWIDGESTSKESLKLKNRIGYLPEIPPLYEHLKVIEQLSFICGLRQMKATQRLSQIDRVVDLLKLQDVLFKPIHTISKGFKQRLGIAQALLGDPKILILDEPSVGLDPQQVYELRQIILNLKKSHTVILSTHVLSEVELICDDVVILDRGQVRAQGPIQEILRKRQSQKVLEVKVSGLSEDHLSLLQTLPGVKNSSFEGGTLQVFLSPTEVDDSHQILQFLIKHQVLVHSFQQKQLHLEDVFREVTQ